jgi:hypothetical protein
VRLAGIEPTTPWFVAKYSIQLSYSRESNIIAHSFRFGKKSLRFLLLSEGLPSERSKIIGTSIELVQCVRRKFFSPGRVWPNSAFRLGDRPFIRVMTFITNKKLLSLARCRIMHLSPLFSLKEIDLARSQ